jgi:hypothetical protein
MRAAVIEKNTGNVVNIINADAERDACPYPDHFMMNVSDQVQIGFQWNGAEFIDTAPPKPPAPVRVPGSITRRQCALQLLSMGTVTAQEALDMTKTATVPAAVAAIFSGMADEARILAEIDFAATNYYRDNSLLDMMGLTSQQIDQFFIAAAAL